MSDPRWNMLFLLFVTLICDSISVNTIPDYITENGLLGHCDSTITNKEDVYIRSHTGAYQLGSAINYGANENCKLTFEAGTDKKVIIKFLEFKLEDMSGSECVDRLEVFDLQDPPTLQDTPTTDDTTTQNCTANNATVCESYTCCDGNATENCTITNNATLTDNCTCTSTNDTQTLNCTNSTDANQQASTIVVQNCSEVSTTSCVDYFCCNGNSTENCTVTNNSTLTDNCTCNSENTTQSMNCTDAESSNSTTVQPTPDLTLCGSTVPSPFVSTSSKVEFIFISNGANNFPGFKILVTSFREDTNCSDSEFHCDANRCIGSNLKCDTVEHCLDGTDEAEAADCSILDIIVGYVFGLGNMTVIVIAILAGVLIFSIVISIIVYNVSCKKNNAVSPMRTAAATDQTTSAQNKGQNSGKGKKTVTVVAPSDPPSANKKATSKKQTAEDDDIW